jgi:membrane-associated phospholipid phosphatase
MFRKIISFILHCRLEDVAAAGFSATLLVFFLTKRVFHTFQLNGHDIIFILLPAGILGVKCLLELLFTSDTRNLENIGTEKYLISFFKPLLQIFRDWFPFFLLSACYYALYTNLMLRVNPHTADAALSRIDAALLGNQASFLLEPWINPWATDFFNFIYFSYVFSLPIVAIYFYTRKGKPAFRRVMMGYLVLMLMGIVSYLFVPAIGPGSFFANRYTHDLTGHDISRSVAYIIQIGRVAYDCFPSLHVGIPLLLSFYLRKYNKRLFIPALVYVAFMCCATVYLRYHYLVDVLAAFLYAPAAFWLNDFLLSHWPGERIYSTAAANVKTGIPADAEPT